MPGVTEQVLETLARRGATAVFFVVGRQASTETGRSLVQALLERGLDVHLIEWEDPGVLDANRDLGAYIAQDLHACVCELAARQGPVNRSFRPRSGGFPAACGIAI